MRRTERLFALAEALRGRRTGITAEALAERFEVSVRTIMRDLEALRSAQLPINTERGRGGGVQLDKSYAMPPVSFTAREALLLLVLARFAEEMRVMPFLATLRSATDKVRASLPLAAQRQLQRLQSSVSIVGVPAHPVSAEVRSVVEQGWFEGTPLLLGYRRADGSRGHRRVRVESVVLERAETLLNCVDLDDGQKRQLRMHQLLSAQASR